jgi:multisubunit Na+/H+ antiporter MnhG subunit
MSAGQVVSDVLLGAGVLVAVAAAVGALAVREVLDRLHYLTPVTSLAGPLVGASLAVANGWGATTAQILLTVALLAVAGPVLESATGRLLAQERGIVPAEEPE